MADEHLQKIEEILKNADQNINNIEDMMEKDPSYQPSTKELLELLDSAEIDDEMKASLRSMLAGDVPQFFGGHGSGTILAIVFVFIIFSIIFAKIIFRPPTISLSKGVDLQRAKMVDIDMGADIGSAIKDQVAQSIQNVDVLGLLQKMVAETPEEEESEEIRQKLQGVLTQYNEMPDHDKVQFVQYLKDILANKLAMKLKDTPIDLSGVEDAIKDAVVTQMYYVGAAVFLFIAILVFFGYKLYKSIKEKEKKREEKKKLKQMKKKK